MRLIEYDRQAAVRMHVVGRLPETLLITILAVLAAIAQTLLRNACLQAVTL